MTKKVDDYYASISDDSKSPEAQSAPKKIIVKKKVKVKAKKDSTAINKSKDATSHWNTLSEENTKTGDDSILLNDALNTSKPSKFKVVSRARPEQRSEKTKLEKSTGKKENSWDVLERKDSSISSQKVTDDSSEDPQRSAKFKSGFSKKTKTPVWGKKTSQDEENAGKKSKIFSRDKSNKYKKNFDDDTGFVRSNKLKTKKKEEKKAEDIKQNLTTRTGETVIVPEFLSLKEFSEKIWVALPALIAEFMKNGMMMTINSQVDFDTASLIAESFEVKLEKDSGDGIGAAEIASGNIKELLAEDDRSKLEERPPVISIMGHVDHGKTSLLDYIRKSRVASWEAGGITQSIGAYQVEHNDKKITFLDTPGHEAFTIMRSRGAKSTDVAILVVAADEWVKPQTIESISHAKEAGIPVIVAINKMDKEGANPDHVKWQLSEHGLVPEDWGWDTPMVPVSAHTGFGIDELLEIILLVSEMLELKANPNRNGVATIIESHLDTKLGPVATVLVNTWEIEKWSSIVCGAAFWKVKVLRDYTGASIKKAIPWDPVLIVWLDKVAEGGDILQVVNNVDIARTKSVEFAEYLANQKKLKSSQLDMLMNRIKSWNLKHLKVVLKADTNGSLEAIKNALLKLSTDETNVSIIHSGVGNITEWDVLMCDGSSAILVGFWVWVGPNAKWVLEDSGVEYIESKIIYHITERIEKIVSGMLDPKEVETKLCEAKVLQIFYTSKKFLILGLSIKENESIEKWALVRVVRWDKVVGKWKIESLKHWVEEVNKLEWPIECGIKFSGYNTVEEKDVLEVYTLTIEK